MEHRDETRVVPQATSVPRGHPPRAHTADDGRNTAPRAWAGLGVRPRPRAPATLAVLLIALVSLGISACGSDDNTGTTSPAARHRQQTDADDAVPPPARTAGARPGCGEFCQQAGPPQGEHDPGCPDNDSDKCAPCPRHGGAELLTRRARVHDGLITVTMRCNADHPCFGAFHLYVHRDSFEPAAASDISVPPHHTTSIDIALTPLGRHFAAYEGDFLGDVYVFLKDTGIDELGGSLTAPMVRVHTSHRTGLTACDQNISAAETTSCPFADNVFVAYANAGEDYIVYITAKSPTTGKSYRITCNDYLRTVYCTGANNAFVAFPKRAARVYK